MSTLAMILIYAGAGYAALALGCWILISMTGRQPAEALWEALYSAGAIAIVLIGVLGFLAAFVTAMDGRAAG